MSDLDVRVVPTLPPTAPLYARALLPKRRGDELPSTTLLTLDHEQDAARLAAYNQVCGFPLGDVVPATWLHVQTFPLQLELLASPSFPVPMSTVVHAANTMSLLRPVRASEPLTLSVSAGGAFQHRRGVMIAIDSTASVDDEPVWRGTSHYLAVGATMANLAPATEPTTLPVETLTTAGLWRLPAHLGRDYASVSGDYNPIHLHPLAAKALGFPRAIIHGMWTHARVLAALQPRLPDAFSADVRFVKPILLPSTVRFAVRQSESGFDAAVTSRDASTTFLTASLH